MVFEYNNISVNALRMQWGFIRIIKIANHRNNDSVKGENGVTGDAEGKNVQI